MKDLHPPPRISPQVLFRLTVIVFLFSLFENPSAFATGLKQCSRAVEFGAIDDVFESYSVLPSNTTVILVANRLPLTVRVQNGEIKMSRAQGGLVTAIKSTDERLLWFGWPGYEIDEADQAAVAEFLQTIDPKLSLRPIYLSAEDKKGYYDTFSNRVIWPVLHGLPKLAVHSQSGWAEYVAINQRVPEELMPVIREALTTSPNNILVWFHDYHFALAPRVLKTLLQAEGLDSRVRIGFFLHIPGPNQIDLQHFSSDQRVALLDGMLGADKIGFHTPNYVSDFENAVRYAQLDLGSTSITASPIGINPKTLLKVRDDARTQRSIIRLKNMYQGYSLLFGVERLDPIKGIYEKLQGYAEYLETHPEGVGNTVLLQVMPPSRTSIPEYQEEHQRILRIAEQINSKFTVPGRHAPVDLRERNFDVSELVAHFSVATAVIINSLRDGMNLVSFETEVAQRGRESPAALILSKHAGAATYLNGALIVDPRNRQELSAAIHTAITMPSSERRSRNELNLQHIESITSSEWMRRFLEELNSTFGSN